MAGFVQGKKEAPHRFSSQWSHGERGDSEAESAREKKEKKKGEREELLTGSIKFFFFRSKDIGRKEREREEKGFRFE